MVASIMVRKYCYNTKIILQNMTSLLLSVQVYRTLWKCSNSRIHGADIKSNDVDANKFDKQKKMASN